MSNKWDGVVGTQDYDNNIARITKIAEQRDYVLNPDQERIRKVVGLMTMNKREFGNYYCPCKQSHPLNPQKDSLCPCPEMMNEVVKDGHCFCKLFYKKTLEEHNEQS
jgi:ferredoxin-thioredoxin reductase catalytic chain